MPNMKTQMQLLQNRIEMIQRQVQASQEHVQISPNGSYRMAPNPTQMYQNPNIDSSQLLNVVGQLNGLQEQIANLASKTQMIRHNLNLTELSSLGGNCMNVTQQPMQITPNSMPMTQNLGQMSYIPMQMNQNSGVDSTNVMNILRQLKDMQGKIADESHMSFKKNSIQKNQRSKIWSLARKLSMKNGVGKKKPLDRTKKPSQCVWVTGIPENYKDADMLMNIFGNFGNVKMVKFAKKKLDGATIQMDCKAAASKVCNVLNDVKLDGQKISVLPTTLKKVSIQEPDSKSKVYVEANGVWRFSPKRKNKPGNSKLRHLTHRIVVRNIPEGKSDDLQKYIIEAGFAVKSIEVRTKTEEDEKKDPEPHYVTAGIEMESIEEAVGAMAMLHNSWPKDFGEKREYALLYKYDQIRNLIFEFARVFPKKNKA